MFEMNFPAGAGIHNGTSASFARAGLTAKVHLPHGPVIDLPFAAPNDFMKVMKWRMHDFPQASGKRDVVDAVIKVETNHPDRARDLIIRSAS